jgi:pimeloyl-ACP methyl ester carboxylesterase
MSINDTTKSDKNALTIKLKDGRTLGYAEYGDPEGKPVFHFNGYPGSRLEPTLITSNTLIKERIQDIGLRFIGVDRPGMGLSDFKKGRTLLDWPDDVIELADALSINKFAVEGVSGGGPYSAACAYKIPERLTICGIISGLGPPHFSTEGMIKRGRRRNFVFKWLPWLVRLAIWYEIQRKMKDSEKIKKSFLSRMEIFPESDRKWMNNPEVLSLFAKELSEAFRQGSKGPYHEFVVYNKPWGFNLEDISPKLKVIIWHGEMDANVPISMGRAMSELIPNCEGRFFPNDGHYSLFFNNIEDIINSLSA